MAVPFDRIGKPLKDALVSAEPSLSFSDQIARSLMCNQPHEAGRYQLNSFRLGWHIRRQFWEQQLHQICEQSLFRCWVTGIEMASEGFFHKDASELNLEEAVLLAGILRGPDYLSPFKHPDRALQRRNAVLETMAASGKLDVALRLTLRLAMGLSNRLASSEPSHLGLTITDLMATIKRAISPDMNDIPPMNTPAITRFGLGQFPPHAQ